MATHQGAAVKYEKLTFTPTRIIEVTTLEVGGVKIIADPLVPRGSLEFRAYGNQFLHPADYAALKAEVAKRAAHCTELATMIDTRDEYVEAVGKMWEGEIVQACVGAIRAVSAGWEEQLAQYQRNQMIDTIIASQVAAGGVDTEGTRAQVEQWRLPAELTVAAWSAELMFSGMNDPDNPMCKPLVWVLRNREQKMPDQRVYTNWTSPHERAPQIKEDEARRIAAAKFNVKKDESLGEAKVFGLPTEKPGRLPANVRTVMVDTIIAEQVTRGGVDTEGTRAQAERWCAYLAECVCDGMRATTAQSALRLKTGHGWAHGDCAVSYTGRAVIRGKPLGRP